VGGEDKSGRTGVGGQERTRVGGEEWGEEERSGEGGEESRVEGICCNNIIQDKNIKTRRSIKQFKLSVHTLTQYRRAHTHLVVLSLLHLLEEL
jgi:hypothetical protein